MGDSHQNKDSRPLFLPEIPDLVGQLRQLIDQVPAGRVTTCGGLADALGNRIAARWIGHFTLHHDHRADCRCHRVIRAAGKIGPYIAGSEKLKARLLVDEGVIVRSGVVDLSRFDYDGLVSDRPLEKLERVQDDLLSQVSLRRRRRIPKLVGGVDVSYPRPDEGVAAYALVESDSGSLVWSKTVRRPVIFPYIPTYLTFRELPILLELVDGVHRAGKLSPVVLVDGSGILHPRNAGVATHLGVVARWPTIGVTKKLLCGEVDIDEMQPLQSRGVEYGGRPAGVALRATGGSRRPIFISPGHRVDVGFAEQVVRRFLRGRRLPEPLYWADRLSRAAGAGG